MDISGNRLRLQVCFADTESRTYYIIWLVSLATPIGVIDRNKGCPRPNRRHIVLMREAQIMNFVQIMASANSRRVCGKSFFNSQFAMRNAQLWSGDLWRRGTPPATNSPTYCFNANAANHFSAFAYHAAFSRISLKSRAIGRLLTLSGGMYYATIK